MLFFFIDAKNWGRGSLKKLGHVGIGTVLFAVTYGATLSNALRFCDVTELNGDLGEVRQTGPFFNVKVTLNGPSHVKVL